MLPTNTNPHKLLACRPHAACSMQEPPRIFSHWRSELPDLRGRSCKARHGFPCPFSCFGFTSFVLFPLGKHADERLIAGALFVAPNVLSQVCQDCQGVLLDLVVCGHSCGCVVALALAFRLETSGLGLRGLVALDRRSRALSHVAFRGFAAQHYPCRLRVRHLALVAPLVPLACLPVRPFGTLASVAAEPGGLTQVCHMLDTNHYTMPFSHAWDLAATIRAGIGSVQRRRRREAKRSPKTRTESDREKDSRFRCVSPAEPQLI